LRKHKGLVSIISLTVLVVVFLQVWWLTASTRGRLAARFHLWNGHYKVLAYGLPPVSRSESASLLKEKYGIETHIVALCIVSETLRSYADSYNEVSKSAANRKFGHDVFEESAEAASKDWERQRAMNKVKE
jgi:hypothetical protein